MMRLPVGLRRWCYRRAYSVLRLYWFVARPRTVGAKCVLTDGDLVLLVRHTYGHAEWELPGGAIRRREQPLHAARREMHEELGLQIDDWRPLGTLDGNLDSHPATLHCFTAEIGGRPLTVDPGEIERVDWFPRERLPDELGRYVRPILARDELD
jgi:8-oxo-dGTP pyrophosphatase MutT (NUDIX family)